MDFVISKFYYFMLMSFFIIYHDISITAATDAERFVEIDVSNTGSKFAEPRSESVDGDRNKQDRQRRRR